MIELPPSPAPNSVEITQIDFGLTLRPPTGAASQRFDRMGTRLRLAITYPAMRPDVARAFTVRLQRARREGLRIKYPLMGFSQGSPGAPVVNGDDQSGTSLALRGLTPGYQIKEGYALTLIDAAGARFLHFALTDGTVNGSGLVTIGVEPPIRGAFEDGDTVLLAEPTVEGLMIDDMGWSLSVDRLIRGTTVTIEEAE